MATTPRGWRRTYYFEMASNLEVLGSVPIFSMLKAKEIKRLSADAHEVSYPAGKALTDEDELGTTFFVVLEGALEATVAGQPVRQLGPGDFFGEMALIDRLSAACGGGQDRTRCLVFTQWVFRPFVLAHPEVAWALLELMVARVRESDARASG